jgi:hypothetical protein
MPKYDYQCDKCGIGVEFEKSIHEETSPTCTGCSTIMSRVWSATPAHFKGGGWGGKE